MDTILVARTEGNSLFLRVDATESSARVEMPEPSAEYPYVQHMNVRFGPLEIVEVRQLADSCTDAWYNQTLCEVNDSVLRLGVMEGEYHWHKHDTDDEFFYVVEGRFIIDLEDRSVELGPGQGFVVPMGVRHRPRAPERSVVLMVETNDIDPIGS